MSDLNDFFAKKDRKKKKAASRLATPGAPAVDKKAAEAPSEAPTAPAPPPQAKQADDGWIEIEDPRGAQVNTGGRTVAEMKRGAEDKETNADGTAPAEKFIGWAKTEAEEPKEEEEGDEKDEGIAQAPPTAFPTLADTANAPQVPANRGKAVASSSFGANPARRRFINSKKTVAPGNQ